MTAGAAEQDAYDALQCYSLAHADPAFIHQHVVDAWAAQQANAHGRPIALAFGLIGLYLHLERGFTGRQVQRAHMALAQRQRDWPPFVLPADRGSVTALQVMAAAPGRERDAAIDAWCASVWAAFHASHPQVARLAEPESAGTLHRKGETA